MSPRKGRDISRTPARAFLLSVVPHDMKEFAMEGKQDTRHVGKVRSAGERTISQPADTSAKTSPVHKVDVTTPSRHASRTMTGKR